jgi:hypothetical protein
VAEAHLYARGVEERAVDKVALHLAEDTLQLPLVRLASGNDETEHDLEQRLLLFLGLGICHQRLGRLVGLVAVG